MRESEVRGKLAEEENIFGAAAEGEVLGFARAEGNASGFCGGVDDKGGVDGANLDGIGGVGVPVRVACVGGICGGLDSDA